MLAHNLFSACIFNDRFPFDSKTPIGYMAAFILECIVFWHNFWLALCLVCFGIGSFLYALPLAEFLQNNLYHINENAKSKQNKSIAANDLSDFIELNTTGKQLSLQLLISFSASKRL